MVFHFYLQVISTLSAKDNPSETDIIVTLAAYLKRNPEIAVLSFKKAKLQFQQGNSHFTCPLS